TAGTALGAVGGSAARKRVGASQRTSMVAQWTDKGETFSMPVINSPGGQVPLAWLCSLRACTRQGDGGGSAACVSLAEGVSVAVAVVAGVVAGVAEAAHSKRLNPRKTTAVLIITVSPNSIIGGNQLNF